MQVVLITGGSSGIGKATGELLQSNGYAVIGTSRSPDHYTDHPFPLIQMDLHDAISIQKAVESVVSQYGAIHVLINNAGKGIAGPIEETPLDEIRSVFETNLVGATAVIQSVIPVMRTQNEGKIVNITSIAGYSGLPFRAVYSATKSALHMLTESLRLELKQPISSVVHLRLETWQPIFRIADIMCQLGKTLPIMRFTELSEMIWMYM